jgi:hypothetical protein
MIVRHDIMVHGPLHEVEMALRVSVRYDPTGKMEAITVEPDDLALFDHVLNTALRNSGLVERRARSSTRSVSSRGRTAREPTA